MVPTRASTGIGRKLLLAEDDIRRLAIAESPTIRPTQHAVVARVGHEQAPGRWVHGHVGWEAQAAGAHATRVTATAGQVRLTQHGICDRVTFHGQHWRYEQKQRAGRTDERGREA